LRSVEVSPDDQEGASNVCPFCGGPIDSRVDTIQPQTEVTKIPEEMLQARAREADTSSDWTGTWSRGSLGSLGRFQLRERLGDGGFGQVFLAFDPRLDRDVALKVLKQPNPSERVMERFFREARAAARLDHPNIVAVHDAGYDEGRCWVAYHFVSGRPLNWYRDHHRLDPPTAAKILRDLADAVDHAHHMGVLHRDLKPANVLIDDLGRPRLIDFGLARRSDLDSSLTHDGAVVGTPAYMSPEQALGFSRQVDERSDVFSLGVIFFEVLSGQRPYPTASQSTPSQQAPQVPTVTAKPRSTPSARAINPAVPAALDRICSRAIAQSPRDRYPSARSLADDLDRWLLQHRRGKVRLSFVVTTILLGLASALLLTVGIHTALLPRKEDPRTAANQVPASFAAPAASGALSPPAPSGGSSPPAASGALSPPAPSGGSSPPAASGGSSPPVASIEPATLLANRPAVQLIGNSRKGVYHRSNCFYVQSISGANHVLLRDANEAAAQGLKPCMHCSPPIVSSPSTRGLR
jgi:serine/threonine protein kinase